MSWMVHIGNKWQFVIGKSLISTKAVTSRIYNNIYPYSAYDACSRMHFCKIRFEESLIVKGAIQNYISFSNIIFLLDGMHFHISEKS